MTLPVQITFHGLDRSPAIEEFILKRAKKLQKIGPQISSVRVMVSCPNHHRHKGNFYHVKTEVELANQHLIVNREPEKNPGHQNAHMAVRDAFETTERQLKEVWPDRRHPNPVRLLGSFALGVLSLFSLLSATPARADLNPKEVDLAVNAIFVPSGFDDNDEVLVVLDGYLPSACHRLTSPVVKVDRKSRLVTIAPRAKEFKGVCPDVAVPFTQEVKLGQLDEGNYSVVSKDGRHRERLVVMRTGGVGPDDFLYTAVDKARVIYPYPFRWAVEIEGRFTNTCFGLEETRVFLTGKTIQVLPIMSFKVPEGTDKGCKDRERTFRTVVELPYLPNEGRYLLHVRSLNGQSLNEVFFRTTPLP